MRFDLRTLPVRAQAEALDDHRRLTESLIVELIARETAKTDETIQNGGFTPDDPEWQMEFDDLRYAVEYRIPQFLRGPHLLMAWAAYEASVTEIAEHARGLLPTDPPPLALDDLGGDFLSKARKYYHQVLRLGLIGSEGSWHKITILKDLRNVLIHSNGRTDRIRPSLLKKLEGWEGIGVTTHYDDLTVSEELTRSISDAVASELRALVARFYELEASVKS